MECRRLRGPSSAGRARPPSPAMLILLHRHLILLHRLLPELLPTAIPPSCAPPQPRLVVVIRGPAEAPPRCCIDSEGYDAWKGMSSGWRSKRMDGGGIFALRIGSDAKCIARLPHLLEACRAIQKHCDDPILGLSHLVGVSLRLSPTAGGKSMFSSRWQPCTRVRASNRQCIERCKLP
jgi:hypothetical protein